MSIGGVESELYASNWFFRRNGHTLMLNIYVDDLTLCGHESLPREVLARITRVSKTRA